MKKTLCNTLLLCMLTFIGIAQEKKEQDKAAIKDMCGCYEVSFNFAETFKYTEDENYQPSKEKHDSALEWVQLVSENKDELVLQHLLIVGNPQKQRIIKHWRQDWIYQNREFYMYDADNRWVFKKLPASQVSGQWTQKVFQVDDSPRYEGSATWVHVDGKSFWENTTDAPLPRREYTKRSDYNVTIRGNRHEITDEGWVHDQDNKKVIRAKGSKDVVLAEEKGYNVYKKVDDTRCIAAQTWWGENKGLWQKVRKQWLRVFNADKDLSLAGKVENKRLYEHLFALENKASKKEIKKIINAFVSQ